MSADPPPRGSRAFARGVRFMIAGCRSHPVAASIAIVTGLLNGASMVLGALAIGWVTQNFIVASFDQGAFAVSAAWTSAALILAICLLRVSTIFFRELAMGSVQFPRIAAHRKRLARRYLRLGPSWHASHPPGQLLSNAVSDVDAAWQPMGIFAFAIGMAFMLVYALASIAIADPWFALIAGALVPVLLTANIVFQRAVGPKARAAQRARGRVSALASESFEGDQVIRTLGVLPRESARFRAATEELRDANIHAGYAGALFAPVIELMPAFAVVVVLAVGVVRVDAGALGVGTVVAVSYLLLTMAIPLNVIGQFLALLPLSVAGAERIDAVLAADVAPRGVGRLPDAAFGVHAQGVTVRDGDRMLLDGVDLGIHPGEVVVVLGATGAGKSTLLRLVARLIEHDDGDMLLAGVPGAQIADTELARRIAVVPQTSFLFNDTIRENLVLGRRTADGEPIDDALLWEALSVAQARGVVEDLPDALDTVVGGRGATLSGGQRQRLAIARALVAGPVLLVLDDATSALDPEVEKALLARLGRHLRTLRSQGTPMTVVIAGNRRPIVQLADRLVLLERGRVVASGPTAEVLTDPRVALIVTAYDDERPDERNAS